MHHVEGHLAPEDDLHDHSGIGEVIVVGGIVSSKFDLKSKLRQADILIDIIAIWKNQENRITD